MFNKTVSSILLFHFFIINICLGQNLQELQKLKNEYDKIKKSGMVESIALPAASNFNSNTLNPNKSSFSPYSDKFSKSDSLKIKSRHFGYDFFTLRDTISFWENLPSPSNYKLGAGDELVVSLWGETQIREKYIISKEGKIFDERVGVMNLSDKSLEQAQEYLMAQFGKIYSTLTDENPSTYMDISLGQLRSINVNFTGAVNYPGVYPIHPFSNLISGLIKAGGVDTTGSLRNILIKRDGVIFSEIDLYKYF